MFGRIKSNKLVKILWSRNLLWSLLFLMLLQIIMAYSSVWLANLGGAGASGVASEIFYFFTLYATSLFVANIPEAASNYYLNKAKLHAVRNYTKEFSVSHKNTPALTLESRFREEREPWLTGESEKTLDEALSVIHISTSMTVNFILTIGTLSVVIDPKLIIGYSFSLLSMPILLKYFKKPLEAASLSAQRNRKSVTQILLSSWENITIGNEYNYKLWWKQFRTRLKESIVSSGRLIILYNFSNMIAMVAIMSPVMLNIVWLMNNNINKPIVLATIIATLSRQMGALFNMYGVLSNIMQWKSTYYPKLFYLVTSTNSHTFNEFDISNRIKFNEILIIIDEKTLKIGSIKQFLEILNSMRNGRITLEAGNGAGKSSLLCGLKQQLRDKAFYLPVNSQLIFEITINNNFSSGEKIRAYLRELFNVNFDQIGKIILLDEWDANLDDNATTVVSAEIDLAAKNHIIIEVRHKKHSSIGDAPVPHNSVLMFSQNLPRSNEKVGIVIDNITDESHSESDPLISPSSNNVKINNPVRSLFSR